MRRFEALLPDAPLQRGLSLPVLGLEPLRRRFGHRFRWSALLGIVLLVVAVSWVHLDERWFIYEEDAHFYGLTYLAESELWPLSKLNGWNVFWIDSDEVRERLLEHPYVVDADVHVSPLLARVDVDVVEVQPVALWVTEQETLWLRDDGIALKPRGTTPPGLLQILDGPAEATAPGAALGTAMDRQVLASAEGLANRMAGVTPVRFNRQIGLNFRMPGRDYWVYWGDGEKVEQKLENLDAAMRLLDNGQVEGTTIDVRFELPFVK